MVNLNNFLNSMVYQLKISREDILHNIDINIFNEINTLIDEAIKQNKYIEYEMIQIFNNLIITDNDINIVLNDIQNNENIIVDSDNIKLLKIATGKVQLKLLLKKYMLYLKDNLINTELINAINNKIQAVINMMESDSVKNKYHIYYKYLKYKNKYLQLKYKYI